MKRYFFDFFDGTSWRKDEFGQEIEDLKAVVLEANESLIILSASFLSKNPGKSVSFLVRDCAENEVLSATITLTTRLVEESSFLMESCFRSLQMF